MQRQISKTSAPTLLYTKREGPRKAVHINRSKRRYFILKRLIDTCLILLSLPIILILATGIAVAIKLDSKGPILFRQQRIGVKRRTIDGEDCWLLERFTLLKFRTMEVNASSDLHRAFIKAYIAGDEEAMAKLQNKAGAAVELYKLDNDPRVTRVGRWLRKMSLDELPQLWNVFVGDMSLVGPRPPIPYEVDMYEPWHLKRLESIQGLTGYWQSSGRSSLSFDEMVKLDIEYIDKQSIGFDFKILLSTVPAVLSGKGSE